MFSGHVGLADAIIGILNLANCLTRIISTFLIVMNMMTMLSSVVIVFVISSNNKCLILAIIIVIVTLVSASMVLLRASIQGRDPVSAAFRAGS